MRPTTKANIAFWSLWLLVLLLWCKLNAPDEPSFASNNPSQGSSAERAAQVDAYLHNSSGSLPAINRSSQPPPPPTQLLCIGIPSVNPLGSSLAYTVASLVDTLSPAERDSIHLIVFLTDETPTDHPAYGQPWLSQLADEVLVYKQPGIDYSDTDYRTIPLNVREDGQPRGDNFVENMRLDRSVLVESCRTRGAPYFAAIEDDMIASPHWFKKFFAGAAHVEDQSRRANTDWLYLTLLNEDSRMARDLEECPKYLGIIAIVYVIAAVIVLELRRHRHGRTAGGSAARYKYTPLGVGGESHQTIFHHLATLVLGLWLPAAIAFLFLSDHTTTTLSRINPFPRADVREMPRSGRRANGAILPNRHLPAVQSLLREPRHDGLGAAQVIEGYAEQNNLKKWALEPSVLRYIERESSEGTTAPWELGTDSK